MEALEVSVEGVLPLLDDADQEEVKGQLEAVTVDFHRHVFDCEAFVVEQWVEDREAELVAMARTAVQVQPLQVSCILYTCKYIYMHIARVHWTIYRIKFE